MSIFVQLVGKLAMSIPYSLDCFQIVQFHPSRYFHSSTHDKAGAGRSGTAPSSHFHPVGSKRRETLRVGRETKPQDPIKCIHPSIQVERSRQDIRSGQTRSNPIRSNHLSQHPRSVSIISFFVRCLTTSKTSKARNERDSSKIKQCRARCA